MHTFAVCTQQRCQVMQILRCSDCQEIFCYWSVLYRNPIRCLSSNGELQHAVFVPSTVFMKLGCRQRA